MGVFLSIRYLRYPAESVNAGAYLPVLYKYDFNHSSITGKEVSLLFIPVFTRQIDDGS